MTGNVPPRWEIRPLEGAEEFRACVELQEETWGVGFSERVPEAILRVAARMGGVISGAFLPDGRMAGFVFGLTGLDGARLAHWSDMLAVTPELRGSGLGWELKMHQRDRLLALGVSRVYWTFDPLVAANAHLNFAKLGVVSREYVEDMYGGSDSPLHRGIGTDRLVVVWELDSERVGERLGSPGLLPPFPPDAEPALEGAGPGGSGGPARMRLDLDAGSVTIAVPADIHRLKEEDPECARRWRETTRRVFRHYIDRGWEVRELDRSGALPRYLLTHRADTVGRGS